MTAVDGGVRVRDDVEDAGAGAEWVAGRPRGTALVASLAARDDRYRRVARLRGDAAPGAASGAASGGGPRAVLPRTGVVDRLVARLHLPLLAGPAARAAGRWRVVRASAGPVDWRPWWRAPVVALALLPLVLAGAVFVAALVALVAADVVLRAVPAPGRAVRRSLHGLP